MHLDSLDVSVGDHVDQGEAIGKLGSSGRSTGPHLHFQVVKNNQTIDPLPYLQ
jgi:murein DD-endopeptidase MepM/ murein hydrolase activator NlpD